jgi:uncharacterized protein YndB with AHSA1/START domain
MAIDGDAKLVGDREIVAERMIDAPPEIVFKILTEKEHIAEWWGPRGFTTTTQSMEVRPGGVWRFCMHGPDGRDYENRITYLEVDAPRKLVYKHGGGKDVEPVSFQVTITLEPKGAQTRMLWRMEFPSAKARDFVTGEYGADKGLTETLTRMQEHLVGEAALGGPFEISRTFRAPRERVFRAWTEAAELARWFGPKGYTVVKNAHDFRVGGTYLYALRDPEGKEMWGKWVYREISPPRRLVFVTSFSDPQGGITRHPMSPTWPRELLSTITFSEQEGGKATMVTVRWAPLNPDEAERGTFAQGKDSMKQGWGGTMDQLEAYLANG